MPSQKLLPPKPLASDAEIISITQEPGIIMDTSVSNEDKTSEFPFDLVFNSLITVPQVRKDSNRCPLGQMKTYSGNCVNSYSHRYTRNDGIAAAASQFRFGASESSESNLNRQAPLLKFFESIERKALNTLVKAEKQAEDLKQTLQNLRIVSSSTLKPTTTTEVSTGASDIVFETSTSSPLFESTRKNVYTTPSSVTTKSTTMEEPANILDILRELSTKAKLR